MKPIHIGLLKSGESTYRHGWDDESLLLSPAYIGESIHLPLDGRLCAAVYWVVFRDRHEAMVPVGQTASVYHYSVYRLMGLLQVPVFV